MRFSTWIVFFLFSCSAHADIEASLKKIVASYRIPQDRLGLYAVDLNKPNHPVLLNINGELSMTPASLSKVLTATAVLRKFNPTDKFETQIVSEAKKEGEVLKGAIYLKGGGDPGFVSETMWLLVNEFYRTGIRQVGDIIVDESAFDSVRFDESRDPERNDRAYDAPVSAMSFNWNSITVYVRPTSSGKQPIVFLDPEMKGWKISNRAKTGGSGKADIRVTRGDDQTIFIDGKIPESVPEFVVYKSVTEPTSWSGEALRSFLAQRGITATGAIRSGHAPSNGTVLAKIQGQPIVHLVADMMKFSNNFVAEMLTKNLAAKAGKAPASLEGGVSVIRDTLIEMGLKKDRFTFVNPSGLSRKNSFKAADLVYVLGENYKSFYYAPEYLAALPVAGEDGTLKSRFKNSNAVGWVRAKTGHLHGVAGLAGFAGQKDGGARAFAFIFNGPEEQGDLARRLFDALAAELVQ
jgi:D-alanyl-D-alanine carboxypeptidase/D-alanyl-D-alanine-endopeptidase (penicillin-binding protein 4)